jgi:hypothetical protein
MIVESTVRLAPAATADISHDREWWAEEAARVGSDRPGVIRAAIDMLTVAGLIAPEASTFQQAFGPEATVSEDWKQIAREAWHAPSWREAAVKYREDRPDISPERVAPPRNRRAPVATIEALMFSLRRGVNEVAKSDTQRRLSTLDADQLEAVCLRVQAFKPAIAEPWSAEDADLLISAWRKFHGHR